MDKIFCTRLIFELRYFSRIDIHIPTTAATFGLFTRVFVAAFKMPSITRVFSGVLNGV